MLSHLQTFRPFRVLVLWCCAGLFTLAATACNDNAEDDPRAGTEEHPAKRVLLVGLDGVQYEKLQEANTPHLDTLTYTQAYTARDARGAQKQFTWSGAGWATILTGTWVDMHGVTGNDEDFRYTTDTVFTHLHQELDAPFLASIINWDVIHTQQDEYTEAIDFKEEFPWSNEDNDRSIVDITDAALDAIERHSPDLTFAMYVNIDEVGHLEGFGDRYQAEIEAVDVEFGRLLDAIEAREHEEWLILVTTDHGRKLPEGKNHGELTDDERLIFIGMNRPGNASFTNAFDTPHSEEFPLAAYPSQASITPTILRYLGVEIAPSWQLADSPLIGAEGPMRLAFEGEEQTKLTWVSSTDSDAVIYKNNTEIGRVSASSGAFEDEDTEVAPTSEGIIRYVVEIDGSTASVSKRVDESP